MWRNIKLLALFNFFTDFQFHSAILVIYFAKVTGSYALAMSLFSVAMLSSAIFEVPTGIFSDKIGRKKTLSIGAFCATLAAIFTAIGGSYWMLFIGALCSGLSRSWYSGNNDAFLHDSLSESGKKENYAHYFGKTSSMFQVALMMGAVIGSILAQWSFSLIMWLSVIPQLFCLIISFFFREPHVFSKEQTNIFTHIKLSAVHLWKNKTLRLLSIRDILNFGIGESSFQFSAAFIGSVWPIWAIGFSKMISFGGAALSYWFSGKTIQKFGAYNILLCAQIYDRIVGFIAVIRPTIVSPILMGSTSIFHGVTSVANNSLMQKEFTDVQRATLGSLNSFLGNIFFALFSPILGLFADKFGPANALLMTQVVYLPVFFITWYLQKRNKKKYEHIGNRIIMR